MPSASINALSLFGSVLAIGIVVDDAIVVVENVERNIEEGLSPKEATYKAMREVSGPIIAIALTLIAVFVPLAFMTGLTGQFYKQFALTISISTIISAFNSLTLSPALSALLLRGHDAPKDWLTRGMERVLGGFFARFNRFFGASAQRYGSGVKGVISRKGAVFGVYAVMLALTWACSRWCPRASCRRRTSSTGGLRQVARRRHAGPHRGRDPPHVGDRAQAPGVESAVAFPPVDQRLHQQPQRRHRVRHAQAFEQRKARTCRAMPSRSSSTPSTRPSRTLSSQCPAAARAGPGHHRRLQADDRGPCRARLRRAVRRHQCLHRQGARHARADRCVQQLPVNVPQLDVKLDRVKAKQLGVPVTDVFDTLQTYLGSAYVNDFNKFGRTYRVKVQADAPYRAHAEDILQLKTRNAAGEMVPLSSLVQVRQGFGPDSVVRYNGFTAADVNAGPAPGFSSGRAGRGRAHRRRDAAQGHEVRMDRADLPDILAGNAGVWIFPLCVLVFPVLAAQYESLTLPLAVILIVPMSLLAAMTGVWLTRGDNNIFTQIGFIVLVGLSAKNAILIVEFARELEHRGRSIVAAAIEASRLRLRPILMTSFAFIMGVVPLVISTGAGAEMRHAMGVAVFAGMLGVTFFGLFLTPVFYVALRLWATRGERRRAAQQAPAALSRRHRPSEGDDMTTRITAMQNWMPRPPRWPPRWCWPAARWPRPTGCPRALPHRPSRGRGRTRRGRAMEDRHAGRRRRARPMVAGLLRCGTGPADHRRHQRQPDRPPRRRLKQARALTGVAEADLYPQLSVGPDPTRRRPRPPPTACPTAPRCRRRPLRARAPSPATSSTCSAAWPAIPRPRAPRAKPPKTCSARCSSRCRPTWHRPTSRCARSTASANCCRPR